MSQQKFRLDVAGDEKNIPVYMKNNVPMLPVVASIEHIDIGGFAPTFEVRDKKLIKLDSIYIQLMEEPDVVGDTIFVSADFFPKYFWTSLCFNFATKTIKTNRDWLENEDECTLFICTKSSFTIPMQLGDEEGFEWQYTLSADDGAITLISITSPPLLPLLPTRRVWGTRYNAKTGNEEYFEEDRYDKKKRNNYTFKADKAGDYTLDFKSSKGERKEFRIVVVDERY